jgi:DNA primase
VPSCESTIDSAFSSNALVVIVEGEKDVVCLASAGVIGTTAPGGTSSWLPEFNEVFRNADVLLIPDCDKPDSKSKLGERNSK